MRRAARIRRPGSFEVPATLHEELLCRLSYLRPVEECPTYVEYFKEGDERPSAKCDLHGGSFEDRAGRAIDRFFNRMGRRLRRIFD